MNEISGAPACANCGLAIGTAEQKFCPVCGQPTPARRIDWSFMWDQFRRDILDMDRGLFYTLRNLIVRPGHMIRDYLEGRREGIVKPLPLVAIMAAVVVVLTTYIAGSAPLGISESVPDTGAGIVDAWINQHLALLTVLLLPLEAAVFKIAFWRFREVNYPEWLAILAFLTAQGFILWSLVAIFQRWLPSTAAQVIVAFGTMAYALVSLMQFFREVPRWNVLFRGLLGHLFFIAGQSLAILAIEKLVGAVVA